MASAHGYQIDAVDFVDERMYLENEFGAGLFADPGLGKTLMTLLVLDRFRSYGIVKKALIVAPLRVVYSTWPNEIELWATEKLTRRFRHTIVHGTPKQKREALFDDVDIYLINTDGTKWLAENQTDPAVNRFLDTVDMLIVDESTGFKNWSSQRSRSVCRGYDKKKNGTRWKVEPLLPRFKKRLILTGTPIPKSYADLFGQMYIVDDGETLGKTKNFFQNNFYREVNLFNRGYYQVKCKKRDNRAIKKAIAPLVYRLDEKDHLKLPKRIDNQIWVDLPLAVQKTYNRFEREFFIEFGDQSSRLVGSAGAKYQLCRGLSNGGMYEVDDRAVRVATHHVHTAKTDALSELVEELHGKPIAVAFQFEHDRERIVAKFPKAEVIKGGDTTRSGMARTKQLIKRWNAGKVSMLLIQPQALSEGENLQYVSEKVGDLHVAWYGLTDNFNNYFQFNKRFHRQGVKGSCYIHNILCRKTVDEPMLESARSKHETQVDFLKALRDYRVTKWTTNTAESPMS